MKKGGRMGTDREKMRDLANRALIRFDDIALIDERGRDEGAIADIVEHRDRDLLVAIA